MKQCPYCAEEIQDEAIICRYCHRDLRVGYYQAAVAAQKKESESQQPETIPVSLPREEKRWGVFGRALIFGLCMGAGLAAYRMNTTGSINDAVLGGISNVFIYGGIYSLIVWIKRAFTQHDPLVSRTSKETGFASLAIFTLAFIIFFVVMLLPETDIFSGLAPSGLTTSIATPTAKTNKKPICYIRGKNSTAQIIINGENVQEICDDFIANGQGNFYYVNGPVDGIVICTASDNDIELIIRDIAGVDATGVEMCRWIKLQQDGSFQFDMPLIADQFSTYTTLNPTPTNESDCTLWSDVTLADVGKTMCVYGTARNSYYDESRIAYVFIFSAEPHTMYFIKHGNVRWDDKDGKCIQVTGEISQYSQTPFIEIKEDYIYLCD